MSTTGPDPLVVITAAGSGSRFQRVGYDLPKPRIPFQGRPLLEWSLLGLTFARHLEVRVVLQREHDLAAFTAASFSAVGLSAPDVVEISHLTDGQASTALLALGPKDAHRPLVIWNVDTYLRPGTLSAVPEGNWLHLYPSTSPSMSYAAVSDGLVTRVAEKVVISPWASSGLYGFASCGTFSALVQDSEVPTSSAAGGPGLRERFVAPLYQPLIDRGERVHPVLADVADVVPLGTPEDLAAVSGELADR